MIEIKKLSAGYGKRKVLSDISLSFEKGKLCCIIGPNGSGKSTLLKTMLGFITPTAGEIMLCGDALTHMKRSEIAKKAAYLSQGNEKTDMTVEQLVLHGRFPHLNYPRIYTEADRRIALSAIEKMELGSLSDRPISELSGGMRQKAYIAMALAQDTEFILLDEPTTYLDISHQLELMKYLRTLVNEGRGIVSVMHDIPLAMSYADEVAIIVEGKVLSKATPETICKSGIIKDIFGVSVNSCDGSYAYEY